MRELKVVGLDADGKNIICQGAIPSEQFKLPVDDRLRAALRDDSVQPEQAQLDIEVTNVLSPKEIQARIRRRVCRTGRCGIGLRHRPYPPVCPPGTVGTLARGRAGNRGAPGPGRRPGGADHAGDRRRGPGGTRP